MMANSSYSRCTNDSQNGVFNAAQDWEIMETWFWKHRKKNEYDTSTEGMLAFLHCVRILESGDESSWYKNYEISMISFHCLYQWILFGSGSVHTNVCMKLIMSVCLLLK